MLSEIVRNITPSATCELEGNVADLRAAGADIIGLNLGEPDFPTPEKICKAAFAAIDAGKTKYVSVSGILELRREISRKLERENGVHYEPGQICVSTGAKQALNNAVLAVINPGDEVLIPTPCWVSYMEIVKLYGGVPVCVRTRDDFQPDLEAMGRAITKKTAAIIINSPNNPTGAVHSRESLEGLAQLAVDHDLTIISDEVYEKLIYGGKEHVCVALLSKQAYEHTVVVNGLSKAFSMTGWRIGYSAAPAELAKGISAIQGHTTSNSATFTQWAAITALRECGGEVKTMVAEFEKRKDYTYSRLCAMKEITCRNVDGAFYLMPDVSAYYGRSFDGQMIRDSFDFCSFILKQAHVAIVPGGAFCAPNAVRVAYTNSMQNIVQGMDRIEKALELLR